MCLLCGPAAVVCLLQSCLWLHFPVSLDRGETVAAKDYSRRRVICCRWQDYQLNVFCSSGFCCSLNVFEVKQNWQSRVRTRIAGLRIYSVQTPLNENMYFVALFIALSDVQIWHWGIKFILWATLVSACATSVVWCVKWGKLSLLPALCPEEDFA